MAAYFRGYPPSSFNHARAVITERTGIKHSPTQVRHSLHPYAWPDFPTPEEWLEEFLRATQRMMLANGFAMPIWFTEVGAPHHGTYPGGLFGYPDRRTKVTGQTRYGAAIYMIKLHVMALHQGVQKIFWYNYIDRRPEREYAENHFGMRDYWDYPKPVYPAYFNLHSCLNGKVPARAVRLHNNVRIYEFHSPASDVLVAWTYPPAVQDIALSSLSPSLSPEAIVEVVNPVGTPIPLTGHTIVITGEPIFIIIKGGRDSSANTLIMRKPLIHKLLHDTDPSVQVVDIECLILNQNISG